MIKAFWYACSSRRKGFQNGINSNAIMYTQIEMDEAFINAELTASSHLYGVRNKHCIQ